MKSEAQLKHLEKIYKYVCDKSNASDIPLLIFEKMINKEENKIFRKKTANLFFEKLKIPSFSIAPQEITGVICK